MRGLRQPAAPRAGRLLRLLLVRQPALSAAASRRDRGSREAATLAARRSVGRIPWRYIITWTLERSDLRNGAVNAAGNATFYYATIGPAVEKDSDLYEALDVLARRVGILGIFSDWPATTTYYANCFGLE